MSENVSLNAETKWSPQAVAKLRQLWESGVPTPVIASALGRPEAEIGAKAIEHKFTRPH